MIGQNFNPLAQKICHDFAGVLNNFMLAFDPAPLGEGDPLLPLVKNSMQKGRVLLEGYRFLLSQRPVPDERLRQWIKNYLEAVGGSCDTPKEDLEKWSLYIIGSLMIILESARPHQKIAIHVCEWLTISGEKIVLSNASQDFIKTGNAPEKVPILAYLSYQDKKPSYHLAEKETFIRWQVI